MATGYPGGLDTYVPTLELSGNLMVSFSRNLKEYAVNRYSKITPVKIPRGAYLYFNPADQARLPNQPYGVRWPAGTVAPTGMHTTLGFEQKTYQTERFRLSTTLDQRSVDIANWDIQKKHTEALAQKMMANRAYAVATLATTSGTYPATNTDTATNLAGGVLSGGTTADPRIYTAFTAAELVIQQQTSGAVKAQHGFRAVMNATTAVKFSRTREIREYLMQSPSGPAMIRMDEKNLNGVYGLPPTLYGVEVVVEDTYYNPNNRGAASDVATPAFADNILVLCVKEDDLDGQAMSPSFSTFHQFVYEDMVVESFPDPRSRLLELTVTDEFDVRAVAAVSGYRISAVFS